jgi:amino acid transporter
MLTGSTSGIILIALSFVAAVFATIPPTFLAATRSIFAWSFDRLVPDALCKVDDRTHSPIIANAIVLLVGLFFLAFIAYGPSFFLNVLYTLLFGQILTYIVVFIAAIILPWRRKQLYEASAIKGSIGPVPIITAFAVIALGLYAFFGYSLVTNNALGANSSAGLRATVIIVVISLAIYPISYLVNRSRGIDLSIAFRELPPE